MSPTVAKLLGIVVLVLALIGAGFGVGTWWWYPALVAERARNDQLAADLTAQQDAVEALREAADKRASDAKAAVEAAEKRARTSDADAQRILSTRPPSGDECMAASALIRKELGK